MVAAGALRWPTSRSLGMVLALVAAGLFVACAAQRAKVVSTITINPVTNGERSFYGEVVDAQQQPVIEALITVYSQKGAMVSRAGTNAKGEFATHPLPSGQYSILVEAQGFSSVEARNVVIGENLSSRLHCSLVSNDSYQPLFGVPPMVDPKSTTTGAVISQGENGQVYVDPQ